MSRFWNPDLAELAPYVPGEQPQGGDLLKLNTNELPFGPSPAVLEALREAADDSLRLYPDPESSSLRQALAQRAGVQPGQVFVGNGSDEVLAHCFRALFQPGRPLLFPDISYSFYPVYARFFGLPQQTLPLREDFSIDLSGYRRDNGGIIFPNPNAPTGMFTPVAEIEALLQANTDTVVLVDEAYIDFGGESAVPLVADYPNLLVVQTMSKSRALAGLRVGMAFGDPGLIEGLNRVKNSFNSYPLDRLAQVGAEAAVRDEDWFLARCREVADNRDWLAQQLEALGFRVLPSLANFLFARPQGPSAESVYVALRERNIIVRHFEQPRIDEFLRISIGTRPECERLLQALREILGKS